MKNKSKAVRKLLSANADVEKGEIGGQSAMEIACLNGVQSKIIRILLEYGAREDDVAVKYLTVLQEWKQQNQEQQRRNSAAPQFHRNVQGLKHLRNDRLQQEQQNFAELSDRLQQEQQNSAELSDRLQQEQQNSAELSDRLQQEQQKTTELTRKVQNTQQERQQPPQFVRNARQQHAEWGTIFSKAQNALKINFKNLCKQNNWRYGKDYSVTNIINLEGAAGSFNLGVYEIEAHCDDAADNFAMKIVMNMVDLGTRSEMYGGSNSGFNTNKVRNRQSCEYLIPSAFSHPLIVPHVNSWIGDINELAEDFPNVLALKQSMIGTNASIVSRTSFLVMPLYETTLSSFFKQTSPEIQAYIIFQLLEVILHLQENYVIHSDFRGDNILVIGNDMNSVKIGLADFGLAKPLCYKITIPDRETLVAFRREMNQNYLPPELKTAKFSGQSDAWRYCNGMDIWSCGITILELYSDSLDCTVPIKNTNTKATCERELSTVIEMLANEKQMPGPVQEICRLLLAFDPQNRNLQRARMIAGRFCWPDVVCDDAQLQEARAYVLNNPYSTDLHKLLKFKFMAEYSAHQA